MNQKTQEQKKMNQQKLENQLNRGIDFYKSPVDSTRKQKSRRGVV